MRHKHKNRAKHTGISGNTRDLSSILLDEQRLNLEKGIAISKAFQSDDVNAIMKAQAYMKSIERKDDVEGKSILVDPLNLASSFGYKDKPHQLSYDVLRAMSKTHIVSSIIKKRKDQVASFLVPQKNKFTKGFIITKKEKFSSIKKEVKLTTAEERKIDEMINFLMMCGVPGRKWNADTLDDFIRKLVDDSLTLDQGTFEVIRNRGGRINQFYATDAATHRIADSYWGGEQYKDLEVNGYAPAYVQVYMNEVLTQYYPWELCFGVRNPSTNIMTNGYGESELERMVQTITALLNADYYNSNFFKVGSAPKGILRYSGNINQNTVEEFRKQWVAQVSGVMNMHKIPLINADKLDFINTTMSNKDMEFGRFQDFLIKIACAHYTIDPAEVGFPMQGSSEGGGGGMFGQNNKEKLDYSQENGLNPLLTKIQFWINKYIVSEIDPDYEFRFVGMDINTDPATELDNDIKAVGNFETLNEVRARRNLDSIEGGDIPLNPVFLQAKGLAMQGDAAANEEVDNSNREEETDPNNPFMKALAVDLQALVYS